MARPLLFALALSFSCITTAAALAIGADHANGQPVTNDKWPDGLADLANRANRVHGYFVNELDVFFYSGDTIALNQFLSGYSRLKRTTLRLVIHPGPKKARSPWDEADRDIPVDWILHASFDRLHRSAGPEEAGKFHTRVDVYIGNRIELEKLKVPEGVVAESGGEIERFVGEIKKKQFSK